MSQSIKVKTTSSLKSPMQATKSPAQTLKSPGSSSTILTRQKTKGDTTDKTKNAAEHVVNNNKDKGKKKQGSGRGLLATEKLKWIQCEKCNRWELLENADIDEGTVDLEAYNFNCRLCQLEKKVENYDMLSSQVGKLDVAFLDLKEKVMVIQDKLAACASKDDRLNVEVTKLSNDSTQCIKEIQSIKDIVGKLTEGSSSEIKKEDGMAVDQANGNLYSEIAAKAVESKLQQYNESITEVRQKLDKALTDSMELNNHQHRESNIVIHRYKETGKSRKEQQEIDGNFCEKLFAEILKSGVNKKDIKETIRLGKKTEGENRPLLVKLFDKTDRNKVMECLGKLKFATGEFKAISISYDMTQKERNEYKELVKEVKAMERENNKDSGEWAWKIKGYPGHYRIVKIKRQNRESTQF